MTQFSIRRLAAATGLDTRLLAMAGALVVIALVFNSFTQGAFLSPRNLWNLAVQTSMVGILTTGMVLVIVTRNIDLSVGSVLGAIGMFAAVVQVQILPPEVWWNTPVTILCAVAVGIAIGAFQGFWIAYRTVPSFIVTLAGLLIFRGVAWMMTEGRTVAPMEEDFQLLGGGLRGSSARFGVGFSAGLRLRSCCSVSSRRGGGGAVMGLPKSRCGVIYSPAASGLARFSPSW
ncbi:ABC transporter permease subunit [Elstera litoralis]|uniref:ABC transporter permease subunit n=1 Tax=Elstera litoralis TaxID=552518 RepID=UPI0022B74378|nr:hypothetical protein [Elstera litoralis]